MRNTGLEEAQGGIKIAGSNFCCDETEPRKLQTPPTRYYIKHELSDVQAGVRRGRGTRNQIANICWIIEKTREFQKNIYFCIIDYAKAFDCGSPQTVENS